MEKNYNNCESGGWGRAKRPASDNLQWRIASVSLALRV